MGDKNVIALLTSINGNLKKIVDDSQKNNTRSPEETQERMTQSLNTGTVLTGDAIKPKSEQAKVGDIILPAAAVASLKTLPVIVLAFAKLKKKDIETFTDTLDSIGKSFETFAKIKDLEKSAKMLGSVANCMKTLDNMHFTKLAVSLKVASALRLQENIFSTVVSLAKSVKKAGSLSNGDVKKLEAAAKSVNAINGLAKGLGIVVLSVAGLAVTIKTVGAGEVLKATGIALGIMTALTGLSLAVAAIAKSSRGTTRSLNHIAGFILKMQGLVLSTVLLGAIATQAWPSILKGFAATSGIILGYTLIAGLASGLGTFLHVNMLMMSGVTRMAAWGMALTLGTLLVGAVATQAWPAILSGFAAITGIILGYTAVATVASLLATKMAKSFAIDIKVITFMAGASIALTLGTLLMGYIAMSSWKEIGLGFVAVSGIILGYSTVARQASVAAKGIEASKAAFLVIGGVIAGAEILLLGAIGLAKLLEQSSPAAMAASITGIAGVITAVHFVAKVAREHTKSLKNAPVNFAIAGAAIAAAELIVLGAVGISKLIRNGKDVAASIGVLAASGAAVFGLVGVLKIIENNKKSLASGPKNLLLAAGTLAAAEGLILGAILIGKIAKKEDIIPAIAVLGGSVGVVVGLGKLLQVIGKHQKDISMGAKSMLLTAGVLLAAESIIAASIGIAMLYKKDPALIGESVLVLGATAGIVYGLVSLIKAVEKHNKDLATGAKSLLLVSATALAAEGIILGAVGLAMLVRKDPMLMPIAAGALLLAGTITLGLVGLVKLVEKNSSKLKTGAKDLLQVALVAAAAEGLILGAIAIAVVKNKAGVSDGDILANIALAGSVVTAFGGLALLAGKFDKQISKGIVSLKKVELLALGAEGLLLGVIALSVAKNKLEQGWDDIFTTIGAMSTVVAAFGGLAALAGTLKSVMQKGIKPLALVELVAAGAEGLIFGIVKVVEAKNKAKVEWSDVFVTLGAMAATVTAFGALAAVAGALGAGPLALGAAALLAVEAVAFAGVCVVGAIVKLIEVKNKAKVEWPDVFITLGAMTSVVAAFGVLAGAAGVVAGPVALGSAALLAVEAIALVSVGLVGAIVKLVEEKNKANVEWSEVFVTLGAMASIVTAFGVLAGAAGVVAGPVALGSAALLAVEAMALVSVGLVGAIVKLVEEKNKANVDWSDVFVTLGAMASVVSAFGVIAGAAGLVAGPVALGSAALLAVESIALVSVGLVGAIVKLIDVKNKANIDWDDVFTSLGAMASVVTSFGLIAAAAGGPTALWIATGVAGLTAVTAVAATAVGLVGGIIDIVNLLNKSNLQWSDVDTALNNIESTIHRFETISTLAASSARKMKKGSEALIVVSEVADVNIELLRKLAGVTATVKELGDNAWGEIDNALAAVSKIISNDDEAHPGLVQLSDRSIWASVKLGAGAVALRQVALTADVASQSLVQMSIAASTLKDHETSDIVNVIAVLRAVTDELYETIGLKFMGKVATINKAKGNIKAVTDIAIDISQAMSGIALISGSNGLIRSAKVASNGKIIYGDWVNCSASAETLASSMGAFVSILETSFNGITKDSIDLVEAGMKMMSSIVAPISTFAETLSGFEAKDGYIRVIKYDENGKQIDTPYVDVRSVAHSIANSVSTFCSTLFSADNASIWENMIKGASARTIDSEGNETYSPSAAEGAMGIFAKVIDPIGNFVSTLTVFESAEGEFLTMPIYDADGKLKNIRKINVVAVAKAIGDSVSTFISSLSAQSAVWTDLYAKYDKREVASKSSGFLGIGGETTYETKNQFADAMGVFAKVVTPIISFANMISMFESGSETTLITYDKNGKKKQIDVARVANIIGSAITTLVSTLGATFGTQDKSLQAISTNQNAIVELLNTMTSSISSIGGIDASNANTIISTYSELLNKIVALSASGDAESIAKTTELLASANAVLDEIRGNVSDFGSVNMTKGLNDTVAMFEKMNTSLKTLDENLIAVDNLRTKVEALATGEGLESSFNKLTNSVTGFYNILSDPSFGDTSGITSAIDKILVSVNAAVTGKGASADIKKAGGLEGLNKKLEKSFFGVRSSLQEFDNVLDSGNAKRVKNIKNIADAIREVNAESETAKENLGVIRDVLQAISNLGSKAGTGELQQVVDSLKSIAIGGGSGGGSTVSSRTIEEGVESALRTVLSDVDAEMVFTYKTDSTNKQQTQILNKATLEFGINEYN